MKNKIFIFSFFLISLFCCSNVNASTKVGINIDAHERFNYYYEQRQNTGFYNFLKNTDFGDYFNTSSDYSMFIFYTEACISSLLLFFTTIVEFLGGLNVIVYKVGVPIEI